MKKTLQIVLFLFLIFLIFFFYKTQFEEEKKITIKQETIDKINTDNIDNNLIKNLEYEININENNNYNLTSKFSEIVYQDGFETVIEGNGSALSGGQRQRIIVAREIYKNPEIIILDEASSALDGKNEANLFSEILNLRQNRIIIVVAHKISKPEMFDQLYEIKNCELIQIK